MALVPASRDRPAVGLMLPTVRDFARMVHELAYSWKPKNFDSAWESRNEPHINTPGGVTLRMVSAFADVPAGVK